MFIIELKCHDSYIMHFESLDWDELKSGFLDEAIALYCDRGGLQIVFICVYEQEKGSFGTRAATEMALEFEREIVEGFHNWLFLEQSSI